MTILPSHPTRLVTHIARIAAGIALLVLATPAASAEAPKTITIAFPGVGIGGKQFGGGNAAAVVHVQRRLEKAFAKDGTRITWEFYKGAGPAINEGMANGKIDFAYLGELPAIMARSAGLDTRVLLSTATGNNTYIAVAKGSKIRSVKDLKGKVITNFKGTALHLSANRVLAEAGLSERDLKVINLEPANAQTALATGQIDAMVSSYNLLLLRDKGIADIIYSTKGGSPRLGMQGILLVRGAFADKYPDAVKQVVKETVAAAHWSSQPENADALYEIWSRTGLPARHFKTEYPPETLHDRLSPRLDGYVQGLLRHAIDDARTYRLIRRDVDLGKWIDPAPLQAALVELKLTGYWQPRDAGWHPAKPKSRDAEGKAP